MWCRSTLLFLVVMTVPLTSRAGEDEVAAILARSEAPTGVVFEIVSGDAEGLRAAIPKIQGHVARLRARFPGLAVAVVSHGREELALSLHNQERFRSVHGGVQDLVNDQVPVHVCGTYAGWHGVRLEDFPAYVDVVSQGPSQIRVYREFGFLHVRVE